jgi:hypothetical protein
MNAELGGGGGFHYILDFQRGFPSQNPLFYPILYFLFNERGAGGRQCKVIFNTFNMYCVIFSFIHDLIFGEWINKILNTELTIWAGDP